MAVKKSKTKKQEDHITFYCSSCQLQKKESEFYNSFNELHKDKFPVCKPCIFKKIINQNTDEYMIDEVKDILMQMNRPFILFLWSSAVKEAKTLKGIFGVYMKNIGMRQYKDLTWKDSISEDEDSDETFETTNQINQQVSKKKDKRTGDKYIEEDKIYSKQWIGHYTPTEIDYLENYLTGLHNDFKVVTESHRDYAKKIAKASLHMDNCFQDMLNGKSAADKRYKDAKEVFDTLSKSAQFSESVRGANDVGLGCFGKVFEKVEKRKWVPQHTPLEKDSYDKMLDQFNTIQKSI